LPARGQRGRSPPPEKYFAPPSLDEIRPLALKIVIKKEKNAKNKY